MKKEEIDQMRKDLKGNTLNKLRKLKLLNCRSLDTNSASKTQAKFVIDESVASLPQFRQMLKCGGTKSVRSEFNPHAINDPKSGSKACRKLLQRSTSATTDRDRPFWLNRFCRSSSLMRKSGSEITVKSDELPERRNSHSEMDCLTDDILSVFGGAPYTQDIPNTDDTSPLIESDVEPFKGARNSFDNLASVESTGDVVCPKSSSTIARDGDEGKDGHLARTRRNKGQKPELRIEIPGSENGSVACNIKPMSAVAERQIEEAIELATTFSRLNTIDRSFRTPASPATPSEGCRTPSGNFRFTLLKNRATKEDKKSLGNIESNSQTNDSEQVMTPAAVEAYNVLIKPTQQNREPEDGDEEKRKSWESTGSSCSSAEESRTPLPSHLVIDQMPHLCRPDRISAQNSLTGNKEDFPSNGPKRKELLSLSRSISLGNPGRFVEEDDTTKCTPVASPMKPNGGIIDPDDDLSPPSYHAPSPPSSFRKLRREGWRTFSESEKDVVMDNSPPPPLPEKKSRRKSEMEDSPPAYPAPCPPPAIPPPALPPRVPLRPSTLKSTSYDRQFPLTSEIPPPRSCSTARCIASRNEKQTLRPSVKEARSKGLCDSVESRSSCESDVGNITHGSEDSVFSDSVTCRHANTKPYPVGRSASLATVETTTSDSRRPLRLNIKRVKLNAAELGIHDTADLFWVKPVNFDIPEKSQSETDLLQDICAPIPGRYETSDSVSYEDLVEFALDGPLKTSSSNSLMCDEVRLMLKMFSNEITVEDCMDALAETCWDVHSAVKLIKLKQVMSTGLADKQQCKQALLFCRWNVNEAALYLLTPPQRRVTPDLVGV